MQRGGCGDVGIWVGTSGEVAGKIEGVGELAWIY